MRVKIFVNKRWTASYKKEAFFFFRSALFFSLRGRRESLQPRQFRAKNRVSCLGSVFHRPIVESLFCVAIITSYIDRSRGKWSTQDKTKKISLRKSTYSRTFSKIIIKQQLPWLPARVRYCRVNIFKTVFKYSLLISFLNISFDISVCRSNSLHICSHLWHHSKVL